jgi:hypothetical protein
MSVIATVNKRVNPHAARTKVGMSSSDRWTQPEAVVRGLFAAATIVFGGLGLVTRDGRLLMAAGAFGILWTLWDVLWNRIIGPGAAWAFRTLTEGTGGAAPNIRPTLDDTIRLLESHLARPASRSVHVQAALRLEEIYRTIRKDPTRARAVLDAARARYPDAPELAARQNALAAAGPTDSP